MSNHLRAGFFLIAPVMIGLAIFILQFSDFGGKKTRFDELALGQETGIYRAVYQGNPVHCDDLADGETCLAGWQQRGEHPVTLWLGNSQLHAINQMKPDDVNGVQVLYEKMAESGNELLAFSEPNASLQEHYVLFECLMHYLPVRTLLLPAVFDDMRETGVRDGLAPALDEAKVRDALDATQTGRQVLSENKSEKSIGDLAGLNDTPQKVIELAMTGWLMEHWSLWEARPEMRGQLLEHLYRLRNSAFGITAQSKRKMIPGRYEKNMAALRAILLDSSSHHIHVILYIVPLRSDVSIPYVAEEYAKFKEDIEVLAITHGAVFANLEGLVPSEFWGKKDATSVSGEAELDFMHFQAGGHRMLAEALFDLVNRNHFLNGAKP